MWRKILSSSLTAAFCLTAVSIFAADKSEHASKKKETPSRILSKVEVQSAAALSEEEAEQVSFAAGRILKHIAQARDAIREGKKDAATGHVEQGLKLVTIIDSVLPHHKVKTEIKSGELLYKDEDDVAPRYVTLFDELERRDIISPVWQAKKEAARPGARGDAAQPDTDKPPEGIVVTRADMAYSAAKLDVALAGYMLGRAKRELHEGKPENADNALLAVQARGVLFEYEEVELPLEEAADNLKLAETEMKEGREDAAEMALRVAIDELKRYEKLVGENRAAEVQALHREIARLSAELEKVSPSEAQREKYAAKISEWWQRATKWFKSKTK
jgi:hypothetical protein